MTIATGQKMYADDILNLTFFPKGTLLIFSSTAWGATSAEFKNIWKVCNKANHDADLFVPDLTDKFLRGAESSDFTTARGADSQSVILQTTNLPSHSHGATGLSLSPLSLSGMSMSSLSCAEGGSHEHTLSGEAASAGGHSHGVTDPGHTHTIKTYSRLNGDGNNYSYWENAVAGNTGTATTGISIQSDGVHTHPFSAASKAVAVTGHTHTITGGAITGSISGGSISGSTANAGSGAAFDVSTVPACYKVIYIIKVV